MKKIIGILLLVIMVGIFLVYTTPLKQYEPHRILEYLGITRNKLEIILETSNESCTSIDVYWLGEKEYLTEKDKQLRHYMDTLLIYSNGEILNQIPDRYGKNELLIKRCNVIIDGIGLYKFKDWYKYIYSLEIIEQDSSLKVNWKIGNSYESKGGKVLSP